MISESWCNDTISNALLTIPGYEMLPDLRRDREDTAGGVGGGLLVYAKTGTKILPLDTRSDFTQHVGFTILTSTEKINVVLVYRPPKNSDESFRSLADLIRNVGPNTLLFGDFNLPNINWEAGTANGPGQIDILEACHEKFLEQLVTFPTHLKGNCLDLLLTNTPDRVQEVENVGRLGSSDHYMLSVTMQVGKKRECSDRLVKNWWKADWTKMREELSAENWSCTETMSAEEAWQHLRGKLERLIEAYVPNKPRGSQGRPPWMTRTILQEVRKKRRMWAKERGNNISTEYKEAEKR
jgi:Endonuclease-reverse transcriptase